jgi:hypothetical protein
MPDAVWHRPLPAVDSFRDDPLYPRVELAYATHVVGSGNGLFHLPAAKESRA